MAPSALRFAAFLSYSRHDKRLARWLVRELEGFSPPREIVSELTDSKAAFTAPRPVFRDEQDMPVGGAVPDRLAEVLDVSATMIVLCTPASVQSDWVNKEIRQFAARHPGRKIIAVVGEGNPDASDCYPPELRTLGEPLAADIRAPQSRRQAVVKIASAILGIDPDQLVGRIEKRNASRRRWIAVGGSAVAGVVVALGATAVLMSQQAGRANERARTSVEVLLTDVREEMKASGRLDSQARILNAAEKYFDGKSPRGMPDEDLLLQAKLMVQKGEDAVERGDRAGAIEFREAAFAATEELLSRRTNDPERLFAHGQSAFWVGDLHWRSAELEQASYYFKLYQKLSEQVVAQQPDRLDAVMEVAYAKANLGQVMVEQFGDARETAALFTEAIATIEPAAKDVPAKVNLSVMRGFQIQAMAQFEPASKVLPVVAQWREVVVDLDEARATDRNLNYDVARDFSLMGELETRAGLKEPGRAHMAKARAIAAQELKSDPSNTLWLAMAAKFELKSAAKNCTGRGVEPEFDFADEVDVRRAVACLESGDEPEEKTCGAFIAWLSEQEPNFIAQFVWSRILNLCSHAKEVVSDEKLFEAHDRVANEMFFSRELQTHSIWTQVELAKFNSAGLNTAKAAALRDDLKRRGWDGYY